MLCCLLFVEIRIFIIYIYDALIQAIYGLNTEVYKGALPSLALSSDKCVF